MLDVKFCMTAIVHNEKYVFTEKLSVIHVACSKFFFCYVPALATHLFIYLNGNTGVGFKWSNLIIINDRKLDSTKGLMYKVSFDGSLGLYFKQHIVPD